MKIETDEKGNIILKEIYNGVTLETNSGEKLGVCMRDSGFELNYNGFKFSFQQGKVVEIPSGIFLGLTKSEFMKIIENFKIAYILPILEEVE